MMHSLNLILCKTVSGGRIYATSKFKIYRVQLKKYVLCTNVRVDLFRDKKSKGLTV